MQDLLRVGPVEKASLPDDNIEGIPAKIDTGADSSAIWATHIVENDARLSFVLFDKNSPFYNGKIHTTQDYQVVSVKNSFGQAEYRYKVKLKLVLGGRVIRARFTLANRASNRFPILIGRRTLRGKFLVDVTRRPHKKELSILMLSTKRTAVTQAFADRVARNGKNLRVAYATYEDLCFVIGGADTQITLVNDGRDIATFELVHFKTSSRHKGVAAATARYLEKRGVPFLDEAVKHFSGTSKLYQYIILESNDSELAVPSSIFMLPARMAKSYEMIKQQLGLPFVLKDIHGNKGEYNYLVKNKAQFDAGIQEASADEVQCIAQSFIPNEGDYRVLVLGKKIALVIHRKRLSDKTHLNNTSQGASAVLIPATILPAAIQKASLAAANLMERQVAGVDIMQDKKSGLWYCLEVNDGPQLATGSFTAEKHAAFADYLERKLT